MQNTLLAVQGLHKSYGDMHAVNGVSFDVRRGEIFGLLGPNGAGKTTIISMVTGLLKPDSGSVSFDGHDFRPSNRALQAKIGLVPQELALYPPLSAWDNLVFFGRIYGLKGQRLRQRVAAVLELVGLTERANDAIETYSGGMKRRINLAVGLLHEPELLFLDEPTVGVDPQARNAILETLETLNRAGTTIFYTTHYMEEAQRLCHRVVVIDHGQIIALDTPQALIDSLGSGIIRLKVPDNAFESLTRQARRLAMIETVSRQDSRVIVKTDDAPAALIGLLDIVNRLDIPITALEILEPNLETVFLQLTGKALRD